jgi:hypothetical protein
LHDFVRQITIFYDPTRSNRPWSVIASARVRGSDAAAGAIATMVGSILLARAVGDKRLSDTLLEAVAKLCTIKPRAPARERVRPAASEFNRSRFR